METDKTKPENVRSEKVELNSFACSRWYWVLVIIPVMAIGVGLWIHLIPSDLSPVSIILPPLPELTGPLAPNSRLNEASRLFEGHLEGPESIAIFKDLIFTGNLNGSIARLSSTETNIFGNFVKCDSEKPCSRPLGFRFDEKRGRLLIADAYLGVYEIILSTGKARLIFPFSKRAEPKVTLFNDVDVLPDGRLVVSESSQRHDIGHAIQDFVECQPTGRVFLVDTQKKTWKVLIDDLYYANGLQVHKNGNSVIVAETMMARLRLVNLDGSGSKDFGTGLPGFPENIRASPRGGYWVAMAQPRYIGNPSALDLLGNWPQVRHLIFKVLGVEYYAKLTNMKYNTIVVRLDDDGNIIESLQDTTRQVYDVSEALEHNGYLYMASFHSNFIGKIKL